ncbi:YolD-like family protein [Paenibacillus thiaminolyticus]|nr:YolD-like family protein [Paenibacillus thiaminolyticus]
MSGKLSGNGIWESSRFIVPEFREALLRRQRENVRRERPLVDEQAWEEISGQLQRSMMESEVITLQLYDPFEQREVFCIVVDIDMISQRIRVPEPPMKEMIC